MSPLIESISFALMNDRREAKHSPMYLVQVHQNPQHGRVTPPGLPKARVRLGGGRTRAEQSTLALPVTGVNLQNPYRRSRLACRQIQWPGS
jgi:hypothetical protein